VSIRVVLADDHAVIRDGLRVLLESQGDIRVVGVASNGCEALELVGMLQPDVAVMDIAMPELNGIDATQKMLQLQPRLQVVILSIHGTRPYVYRALKAGARGYLLKETAGVEILDAVRAVQRGERYLSQQIANLLMDDVFQHLDNTTLPLDVLSPREREVLQLVVEGQTSQEIAQKLALSPKTVDSYRSRLMHKIGVKDMTGLVRFAIRNGLITVE
jgi:two-component system, NarL family, response regulator NreC